MAWTFGRQLSGAARNLAIAVGAAVGATALASVGLPMAPGLAIVLLFNATIMGVALGEPLKYSSLRLGRMAASALLLLGAGAIAADQVAADARVATGAVALGAISAVLAGGVRAQRRFDTALIVLAAFYVLGVLVLCVWLDGRPSDDREAGAAIGGEAGWV